MKLAKRLFAILLCTLLCFSVTVSVFAATGTATIKISSADNVMPGDVVTINIDVDNNPGIMAMAFCVTYDKDAFEFVNHEVGYVSSFTYKNHPDKGHISFVNVENKDKTDNGTLLSVIFKVKPNAKPGKHTIGLANSNREKYGTKLHNSFSNSKQEFIVPNVKTGTITIAETCENAGHKYGEWNIIRENSCTEDGLKSHVCSRCNITEEVVIPAAHTFESEWTIDKIATPEEDGIMSRHCTKCDAKTDEFTFSYEEIGDDETPDDTSSNESSSPEDTSQESSDTDSTSSDNTSSNNTSSEDNNKPNVDNIIGEKVPQQEAEKFEEFPPDAGNEETSSEEPSSEPTTSETSSPESVPTSSDTTTNVTDNNNNQQNEEPTFFDTPAGIILMVVAILLSVGIIALGIILIIRKQKS